MKGIKRAFWLSAFAAILLISLGTLGANASTKVELKFKVTGSNVALNWNSVSGAKKYAVYRSESKKGTYNCLGMSNGTAFTDKTSKKGITYFYSVKTYSGGKWSALCTPRQVCVPDENGLCKIKK